MTEPQGGARPAANRPATTPTVSAGRRWQPDPKNVTALDRHITSRYGPEYVRRSRS